ncbi:hypothetical protein [Erwinia sp. V71]|uniref:hypothetical protein n=1 Tax=Erwinia sp. V71 TaxID=3369424 RepID=UPI003F5E7AF4
MPEPLAAAISNTCIRINDAVMTAATPALSGCQQHHQRRIRTKNSSGKLKQLTPMLSDTVAMPGIS